MTDEQNEKTLEEIAKKYQVNALINDKEISVPLANSMGEAETISKFWREVIVNINNPPEKIEFVYQEKNKEMPLPYIKQFIQKIGFKVEAKKEDGEVKYESIKPESILNAKSLEDIGTNVSIITNKKEWGRFNKIAENSNTFSAPYVLTLANLCYRVNIPLECIIRMELKN